MSRPHALLAASPRIRFLLRHTPCFLEDSSASRPGRRTRPRRRPERQQIMLRRGLALGGGLLRPDPDRARRQGLPRRAQAPGAERLRPQRHPDRRRDRSDQQVVLRQARGTRRPLGDRVRRRGQRRPQRDGQLRQPRRRPRRARRHGQRAELARAGLRAARQRDGRDRRPDEHRARRRRLREGDGEIAEQMQKLLGQRRHLRGGRRGPKSTACSPTTGSRATTCRRASSSPTGPSGSTKARSATALGSVSGSSGGGERRRPRPRPDRRPASTAPN